jgi:hypothetical protein
MTDLLDAAVIPVTRDCIVYEYEDSTLAVRFKIDAEDVDTFFAAFPESDQAIFLSDGASAIEAVRGPLIREFADGGLALKVLILPQNKREFRRIWPKPKMIAVMAREDPTSGRQRMIDAAKPPKPQYGHLAKALRTHIDFMNNPKVWAAVGTDEQYLAWCRLQKCAKCGWVPHDEMNDFIACEAAHVRRIADGAGTALKPTYSAIPLCPTRNAGKVEGCHQAQHRVGESFLGGKESVDNLRIKHVQTWVWETLKAGLGFEHFNEVPPETLIAWAGEHGVGDCVPDSYFDELRAA